MGGTIDNNGFPNDMIIDFIKVYKYTAIPNQINFENNNSLMSNNLQGSARINRFYDLSGRTFPAPGEFHKRVADGLVIVKNENGVWTLRALPSLGIPAYR